MTNAAALGSPLYLFDSMPFKLMFVAAFVIAATVATRTAKHATRRHGGSLNQLAHEVRGLIVVRAALGIIFYTALFAWLFWSSAWSWMYVAIPNGARWLAGALLVPVLAFFSWSFSTLGTNYRGGVGLYDSHELVTTGPYRFVRHPIYMSFIAIMLLVFPLSTNWLLALSGLALVVSIAATRGPIEDRELQERFGDRWTVYRRRTGAFLPLR